MLIMKVKDPQLNINWQRMLKSCKKKNWIKKIQIIEIFCKFQSFFSRFIRLIFHVITINCNKQKIIELHLTLWLVGGRKKGGVVSTFATTEWCEYCGALRQPQQAEVSSS